MIASVEVWAIPLNTVLLIILALTNAYLAKGHRSERRDLIDVKQKMGLNKRDYDKPVRDHVEKANHIDTGERRRATDHSIERRRRTSRET